MNIDILSNSLNATEYHNIMLINNFVSCINNYTRVFNGSKSCLDHIFSKNISIDNIISYIVKFDITDHFPTIILISSNSNLNSNKESEKSDTRNVINIDHLNMLISTENWDQTLQNMDIDKTYEIFSIKMQQLINVSTNKINLSSRIYKKKKLKEWITQGLIVSIGKRNTLSNKLRLRPFDRELKLKYSSYRNLLNTLIKKAKIVYYQKKIKSAGADSKSMWKVVN